MQLSNLSIRGLMLMAYAHLKNLDKPWWIAALISWGIALFEYLRQVPANHIGYRECRSPSST